MFQNVSFRNRLLIWVMPILVSGLFGLSVGTYLYVRDLIQKEFTASMLASTGKTADSINTWLRTLLLEPETIASTAAARAINTDFSLIDRQNISRHKILHQNYPDIFQDIYAANRQGEYHTVIEKDGMYSMFVGNIANRDYFRSIMAGGPAQITQPLVSRTTGIPTIFAVAPIRGDEGSTQGLIGAGISLNYISVVAEGLKAYQSGYGIVLDKEGKLIYHPNRELVMQRSLTEFEELTVRELGRRMMSGGSGVFSYTYLGQKKIAFYQPIRISGWSVATVVPVDELFLPAVRLLWVVAAVTLLLTCLVCLVIFMVARRLTEPLHELATHAGQLAAGNMDPGELKIRHHDEIGTVAESFNTMTRNLNRMVEVLQNSESKYRSMINNINVGIYRKVLEPEHRFIQVNPAMVRMFGYESEEELLGILVPELYLEPNQEFALIYEIRSKGDVRDRECCYRKKDGTAIWCSVTANAEYDEQGRIKWVNGFIEEITERKKLAEQLRQSQKMEAIGTLAGGIAHDFNNMLTAIVGYSTLCKMKMGKDSPAAAYINDILDASERATQLTRSLLTFSRKQVISLRPVNLNDVVRQVEKFLRRVIGEDVELKTYLCEEELLIMADVAQIEQVLMNLATNARDAMPEGGTISISSQLEMFHKEVKGYGLGLGAYAVVAVSDTGCGMDNDTRLRIFEPFFTTKEVGKGTGLGLAIVYGIIKQHNGEIYVYSEPGKGTTFKVYLKLLDAAESQPAEVAKRLEPVRGGTETILVAEDDAAVRKMYCELLSQLGYKVVEAANGEEAVSRFMEYRQEVKLLLFDVIMPKMNGKDAYEAIARIDGDVRIIFSSGYTADIISQKGLYDNSAHYVSKPVNPTVLAQKVRAVLDGEE